MALTLHPYEIKRTPLKRHALQRSVSCPDMHTETFALILTFIIHPHFLFRSVGNIASHWQGPPIVDVTYLSNV